MQLAGLVKIDDTQVLMGAVRFEGWTSVEPDVAGAWGLVVDSG